MSKIEFDIPGEWVTEWNMLYVVAKTYETQDAKADRANACLAEWDYPHRLTGRDFWPDADRQVLYVDPAHIAEETWPTGSFGSEHVEGWVKVYRIDLDAFATDRPIGAPDA